MNPFAWSREEVCLVSKDVCVPTTAATQVTASGDKLILAQAPSVGFAAGQDVFAQVKSSLRAAISPLADNAGYRLSNQHLQVDINRHGQLSSALLLTTGRSAMI